MIIKKYKKFFESLSSIWDLDEEDIREFFYSLEDDGMEVELCRVFLEYEDSKIKYFSQYNELDYVQTFDIEDLKDRSDTISEFVIGYHIDLSYENDLDVTNEFFAAIERLKELSKNYELKIFKCESSPSDEEITDYLLYVKEEGFYYDDELSTENILITFIKKIPYTKEEILNSL